MDTCLLERYNGYIYNRFNDLKRACSELNNYNMSKNLRMVLLHHAVKYL